MAAVTLAIGLAAGYAAGHGQGRSTDAVPEKPPSPAGQASGTIAAEASPPSIGFGLALTQQTGTCSVQAGRELELGIPVTNQSGQTVQLESARPVSLAPGMLKVRSWRWDPCGFDNDGIAPATVTLGPGETTWVTAVVQPLVACPGPATLQFQVTYSVNRQKGTSNLPGFSDLTAIHFSGCPTPAA
jgi:hypothetical protein